MHPSRQLHILLIEDNAGDVRLMKEALKEGHVSQKLDVVYDGDEAIKFLSNPNEERPDIIILDLNIPKIDGREVLKFIKSDPRLKIIPVIVLTTSHSESDMAKCYELQANCYIVKPVDYEEFVTIISRINDFWFKTVSYVS